MFPASCASYLELSTLLGTGTSIFSRVRIALSGVRGEARVAEIGQTLTALVDQYDDVRLLYSPLYSARDVSVIFFFSLLSRIKK